MKEKKISNKTILNKLVKQNFIEICPVCDEQISDLIYLILDYFGSANFNVEPVEDQIYCLKITI